MKRSSIRFDLLLAATLSIFAALVRAPYLALIPRFEDEVLQTVYALSIGPGEPPPLAGADAYSGPLFTYLLAAGLRVFGSTPVTPRIVVMILGALTAGMTYGLARAVGLKWPWAALAGLLLAANPLHIVVNSHHAASTVILPLFSTAFLAALALAARRKSGRWLVVAGALLGLAGQANPVIALMLPGVIVWFLTQREQNASIGLRTRWPYLAAAVCLAAYASVIVYNIQNELLSARIGAGQAYVWQPNLSLPAFAENLGRLMLQLGRQVSGVLEGDESLKGLAGMPILFSAWAFAGLIYTARRGMSLLAFAVGSQVFIMPWVTDYYGMVIRTRFTSPLTPLMTVAMGALAAGLWAFASERLRNRTMRRLAVVLLATLSLWPLTSLLRYYEDAVARGETNAPDLAFLDELLRQWRGEKIFLSESLGRFNSTEYLLAVHRVPYNLMPLGRIMEQLATGQETGPVILVLDKDDLPPARAQADLIAWDSPAMRAVYRMDYGAYTIADARQVRKPAFVFTDTTLGPTLHAVQANLADQLGVIGYEIKPERPTPGGELVVNVHWQARAAMSEAYTGFLHLIGLNGQLVTQDDHELGRGFYRTLVWQTGEVVRERYTLTLPKDTPAGDYALRVGAYSFPSLQRLAVKSSNMPTQDNAVRLGAIHVGP